MNKPGPKPLCLCGECRRCRVRRNNAARYRRMPKEIACKNAEYKRRRKLGLKSGRELSDQEMDRRAAEWLSKVR